MNNIRRLFGRSASDPAPQVSIDEPYERPGADTAGALWGGILDTFSLDMSSGTMTLTTHVNEGGRDIAIPIECRRVRAIEFVTTLKWPWSYAETTWLQAKSVAGGVQLDIGFWVDETVLSITAGAITVGGEPLLPPYEDVAGLERVTFGNAD
jgi:hypothetical protein